MNNVDQLRITKLKDYLLGVIEEISNVKEINANALSKDIGCYSLDKIPTQIEVEKWICGTEVHKDVFSFRSRRKYSYGEIENLMNIGFFEAFENLIKEKNKKGILPNIDEIEKIECLNCGTLFSKETGTAEFGIQLQITYRY